MNGYGIITSFDQQCIYKGEWSDGLKHGKGFHKTPTFEYEGYFVNGRKHGKSCSLKLAVGNSYHGDFNNYMF